MTGYIFLVKKAVQIIMCYLEKVKNKLITGKSGKWRSYMPEFYSKATNQTCVSILQSGLKHGTAY